MNPSKAEYTSACQLQCHGVTLLQFRGSSCQSWIVAELVVLGIVFDPVMLFPAARERALEEDRPDAAASEIARV